MRIRPVTKAARYPGSVVWEAIFLLAVLKIPVIYVCCVAWWAIRAEPRPFDGLEPAAVLAPPESDPRPGTRLWRRPRRPRAGGPHGRPLRTYGRRTAYAQTRVRP
jgi:hypothetical protein